MTPMDRASGLRAAFLLALACLTPLARLASQQRFDLTVQLKDAKPLLPALPESLTAARPLLAPSGVILEVKCEGGADCTKLTATVGAEGGRQEALTPTPNTKAATTITLPDTEMDEAATTELVLSYDGQPLQRFKFTRSTGAADDGGGRNVPDAGAGGLAELLATDCRRALRGRITVYDRARDVATFVVTPRGRVLLRPQQHVDENDAISVIVVADTRLLPLLRVERKSPIRDLEQISILGEGERITRFAGALGGPSCGQDTSQVGDFAPGRGVVEIRALKPGREDEQVTGSFDFNVNRLYVGMFSLGAIRTELEDPEFGLAFNGQDSVIVVREDGSPRILYTVMFTPFLWGRRDSEKGAARWWHHVNPSVGIVLKDVGQNAVAGLTVDVANMFLFHGGVHGGRVRRLNEDSPFREGDVFPGPSSALAVRKDWKFDWFAGVTVDLRVAARLLRAVVAGST